MPVSSGEVCSAFIVIYIWSIKLTQPTRLGEIAGLGGYSEYTIADQHISFDILTSIPRDQASTAPLAAATARLALVSKGCLILDRSKAAGTSVLVWGGSCKWKIVEIKPTSADFSIVDSKR